MTATHDWRSVIAVLANPDTRRVAARMMLGDDLDAAAAELKASKRRKVISAMQRSGLVDAEQRFAAVVLTLLLQEHPAAAQTGIDRFLKGRRIQTYPANLEERGELLAWVAQDAFDVDEVLDEREVNDRLRPYHEDVAVLRRYLVDYQLLERRADGTEYARTGSAPIVTLE